MLTILLGTDWTVNRDEILKLVAQDVHNRRDGRILMVPELISHDMERRLCETVIHPADTHRCCLFRVLFAVYLNLSVLRLRIVWIMVAA